VTEREDVRDVLVSKDGQGIAGRLPQGRQGGHQQPAARRPSFWPRPDLAIVSIRGNVETRLKKLDELGLEAVVLAAAGLAGWGSTRNSHLAKLATDELLPAVGQGALGLEVREDDAELRRLGHRMGTRTHRLCRGRGKGLSGPPGRRLPGAHCGLRREKTPGHHFGGLVASWTGNKAGAGKAGSAKRAGRRAWAARWQSKCLDQAA
jgi:hypothetical protein